MITNHISTYETRNTEYKKIHAVSEESYTKVIESLKLFSDAKFADVMAGHGEMSDAVIKYCADKGFYVQGIILDAYEAQLPKNHPFKKIVGDIREPILESNSLDRLVIKLGLHEIPNVDQEKAISQIYNSLKPGGIGVFWELGLSDVHEQEIFQQIVRKKDELAGFDDLVKNRYFCMESELRAYFQKCRFSKIELMYLEKFHINTSKWLENDLAKDSNKLYQLNEYIISLPEFLRKQYNFKKENNNISMDFAWPIFRVTK